MANYRLHYGNQSFELADAKEAVKVMRAVENIKRTRAGGRVSANLVDGAVHVFVDPSTQLALSVDGTDAEALAVDSA